MNLPSFDPLQITGYGTCGQETAQKMSEVLKEHSLSISYNSATQKFTISGNSEIDEESLERIFAQKAYQVWQPLVLEEKDKLGNRLVQLIPTNESLIFGKEGGFRTLFERNGAVKLPGWDLKSFMDNLKLL